MVESGFGGAPAQATSPQTSVHSVPDGSAVGVETDGGARRGWRPRRPTAGAISVGIFLVVGVVLRGYALIGYHPAVLTPQVHDAAAYIHAARVNLGSGAQEPLGYPLFLRIVHAISHELAFTIAVQHVLGLATGVLLLGALRRLGAPVWVSLVPAAIVWLCGDQLFLEHAPLSESLFTFLLAATLYAAARALSGGMRWPALVGALAASLLAVRTIGVPLPALVVVWLAVALWRVRIPWRRPFVAALSTAVVVTAGYATLHAAATDRFTVLADGSGWTLYARAAQFANCHDFTPPRGTRVLCDRTPPARRRAPEYYLYLGGPAHNAFGEPASDDSLVGAFARAAIVNQPLNYLKFVGADMVRYVVPSSGNARQVSSDAGPDAIRFRLTEPAIDPATRQEVTAYYGTPRPPSHSPVTRLDDYQHVVRLSGTLMLALVIFGLAGTFAARGRIRWFMILLLGTSLELVVAPALTQGEWRYAVPAEGPTAAVAALGVWSLMRTSAVRRRWPLRRSRASSSTGVREPQPADM